MLLGARASARAPAGERATAEQTARGRGQRSGQRRNRGSNRGEGSATMIRPRPQLTTSSWIIAATVNAIATKGRDDEQRMGSQPPLGVPAHRVAGQRALIALTPTVPGRVRHAEVTGADAARFDPGRYVASSSSAAMCSSARQIGASLCGSPPCADRRSNTRRRLSDLSLSHIPGAGPSPADALEPSAAPRANPPSLYRLA